MSGSKARSIFSRGNLRRHTTHEKSEKYGGEDLNDKVSVITQDRLKQFNQIQGTYAGTMVEEHLQKQADAENNLEEAEAKGEAEEAGDEVAPLREENKEELASQG